MLRLPPFDFRRVTSVGEAAAILAGEGPAARLVAGGTDLWPNMKRRHQTAKTVVSLMSVPELSGIHNVSPYSPRGDNVSPPYSPRGDNGDPRRELRIGATTTLDAVASSREVRARYPALARAVASISSPPLRNMGTIGGNVCLDTRCTYYNQTEQWRRSIDYCMKEEGSVCWVAPSSPRCWAHSASDSAPMLCALGARVKLVSQDGERTIPMDGLYRDDGIDYLAKEPGEIVSEILVPADASAGRVRSSFWKLRRRGSIDFAVLSVSVVLRTDDGGVVQDAKIYLGAVGSWPIAASTAEQVLVDEPMTEERIAEAARLAKKAATPMDNTDFQAQWRGLMVERYTSAALREAAGLDPGLRPPRHHNL